MSDPVAIAVNGIGKSYRIWREPEARLTAPALEATAKLLPNFAAQKLRQTAAKQYKDFWALRDISFEVRRGESYGIIGRNGSGKSTLLQIIAGTLQPTTGTVEVRGKVAALLELGSGFNPEFTGRENVYLNAAILGLSRAETDARFDQIAAFADIGDFLDQPVKTYSSGMMIRLAFSVQTAIEPDILIIDEALAVGDFFFQQKCFQRIRELRSKGVALLFVSHDMASVRDLCERALYLRSGCAIATGTSQNSIALFYREGETPPPSLSAGTGTVIKHDMQVPDAIWRGNPVDAKPDAPAELIAVEVLDSHRSATLKHRMGSTAFFRVYFRGRAAAAVHVALEIKNRHGHVVSSLSSKIKELAPAALREGETWCFEAEVKLAMEAGLYTFQMCLGLPNSQPNLGRRFAETPWLGPLNIDWDYATNPAPFLGMFDLPATLSLRPISDS